MNLTAIIPSGQQEITVNGLHQWDYGRKLEIHSNELPAIVEVHFACAGMDEAVVRVCETVEGVAVATIPDKCLEQTTPITAWVYEIDGTTGLTTKKITLPIIARTRPSVGEDIPVELSNAYTEAVTAMNEAVAKLSKGDVKVSNAVWADVAGLANDTLRAQEAKYASEDRSKGTIEERLTALASNVKKADTATDLLALYLHIYQAKIDVYSRGDGTKSGTLFIKISTTAPKVLNRDVFDKLIYTASNTTHYFEGFFVDASDNYYPLTAYTCTSSADNQIYYTISLEHTSIIGVSPGYTPSLTVHQLY